MAESRRSQLAQSLEMNESPTKAWRLLLPSNKKWQRVLLLLGIAAGSWLGWPVSILLLVSAGAYWLAGKDEEILARTARNFLLPFTAGLAALTALVACLKVFGSVRPQWVFTIQDGAEWLMLKTKSWTHLSLAVSICILCVVLLGAYLWPKTRAVTRYLKLQKTVSAAYLFLVGFTSFVIFVQGPAEDWARQAHQRRVWKYKAALREEEEQTAKCVAAETVQKAVRSLSDTEKAYLHALATNILQETTRNQGPIVTYLTARHTKAALKNSDVEAYLARVAETVAADLAKGLSTELQSQGKNVQEQSLVVLEEEPESNAAVTEEKKLVDEQSRRTEEAREKAERATKECKTAITEMIAQIAGAGVPEIGEVLNNLLEDLISQITEMNELLIEASLSWFRQVGIPQLQRIIERLVPDAKVAKVFLVRKQPAETGTRALTTAADSAKAEVQQAKEALNTRWVSDMITMIRADGIRNNENARSLSEMRGERPSSPLRIKLMHMVEEDRKGKEAKER